MLGKKSYLHKNAEGKVHLMSNHFYHYQVQTQLFATGFKFCDFFVRTEKDTLTFFYQNLLVNILQT